MNNYRQILVQGLAVGIASLMFAQPASAMRCGSRIVNKGDHQTKILKYCGDPTHVIQRTIYRSGPTRQFRGGDVSNRHGASNSRDDEVIFFSRSVVEVIVEEWTYNLGPRKLMRTVFFENGVVTKVQRLGYGYNE